MGISTLLLTAVGLAMDAFSVSVSSGIFIKKLKFRNALKIGLYFGVFQFIMPCMGWLLGYGFAELIGHFAPWIAFVLLSFVGGKMLFESINPHEEEITDPLNTKLLFLLAISTSIDALAVGVTYAAMNMPPFGAPLGCAAVANAIVIGIVAFILSVCGVYIGNKSGDIFGNKAGIVGGIVLIGIGIKILIESFI